MNKKLIAIAIGVVLLLGIGGGGYWYVANTYKEKQDSKEITTAQLNAGMEAKQAEFDSKDFELPGAEKMTYTINEDGTTTPELNPLDDYAWNLVEQMAPSEETFKSLREFTVYYDESDLTDASVTALDDEDSQWSFELNYSATNDFKLLIPVLVHEYSHVLSLEDSQIISEAEVEGSRESCVRYLVEEGCLEERTMLNTFFSRFWKDNPDYVPNVDRAENETEAFYETRKDQYVTDYATTNPIEDFAESIMFYTLKEPVEEGTEKREKTDFFNDYPAVVSFRTDVRLLVANWAN